MLQQICARVQLFLYLMCTFSMHFLLLIALCFIYQIQVGFAIDARPATACNHFTNIYFYLKLSDREIYSFRQQRTKKHKTNTQPFIAQMFNIFCSYTYMMVSDVAIVIIWCVTFILLPHEVCTMCDGVTWNK